MEKIDKRGFAYECLMCLDYRGEKRYVETHIYKMHLKPEEVPFYCTLCHYMSRTERDLNRHLKGYKPHKAAIVELTKNGGVTPATDSILVKNPNPRSIDGTLMQRLTEAESKRVWSHRVPATSYSVNKVKPSTAVAQEKVNEICQDNIISIPESMPIKETPLLDLPYLNDEEQYDLLKDILAEEATEFDIAEPEVKVNQSENPDGPVLNKILTAMTDLQQLLIQQNQLLTSLNTGIHKNTIITDELVGGLRNTERRKRNRRIGATAYQRRRTINNADRSNRASPRVKSKVVRKN